MRKSTWILLACLAILTLGALFYAYDAHHKVKLWQKEQIQMQGKVTQSEKRASAWQEVANTNKDRADSIALLSSQQSKELTDLRTRFRQIVGQKAQVEDQQLLTQTASDDLAKVTVKLNDCISLLEESLAHYKTGDNAWIQSHESSTSALCDAARKDLDDYVARYN